MHTMTIEGYTVHHNGDFSGEVELVPPSGLTSFTVPMSVLRHIVAAQIVSQRIADLESAIPDDILK